MVAAIESLKAGGWYFSKDSMECFKGKKDRVGIPCSGYGMLTIQYEFPEEILNFLDFGTFSP